VSDHFHHRFVKLGVAYQVVLIAVDLGHDLVPEVLIAVLEGSLAEGAVEHSADFLLTDEAIAVFIENVKCDAQVLPVQQARPVHGRSDEFLVVNFAVLVSVELVNEVVPVLGASTHGAEHLVHAL